MRQRRHDTVGPTADTDSSWDTVLISHKRADRHPPRKNEVTNVLEREDRLLEQIAHRLAESDPLFARRMDGYRAPRLAPVIVVLGLGGVLISAFLGLGSFAVLSAAVMVFGAGGLPTAYDRP